MASWKEWGPWLLAIVVALVSAVILDMQVDLDPLPAATASWGAFAVTWSDKLVPALVILIQAVKIGFPWKHYQLPTLDAVAVGAFAAMAMMEGAGGLWSMSPDESKIHFVGCIMLLATGYAGVARSILMAHETHEAIAAGKVAQRRDAA